jgi:hypothetical protein
MRRCSDADLRRVVEEIPPKSKNPSAPPDARNNKSAAHSDKCLPRRSEENELMQAIREIQEFQHHTKWVIMKIKEGQLREIRLKKRANRRWKRREKQRKDEKQGTAAVFGEVRGNHTGSTVQWDPSEESRKLVETQSDRAAVWRLGEPLDVPSGQARVGYGRKTGWMSTSFISLHLVHQFSVHISVETSAELTQILCAYAGSGSLVDDFDRVILQTAREMLPCLSQ